MMRQMLGAALLLVCSAGLVRAQGIQDFPTTIKMVDAQRGTMLMAVPFNGGIKITQVYVGKDTQFLDEKGQKLKDGLRSDAFKATNNHPSIPVKATFNADGTIKSLRLNPSSN